eukprot:TRINITY_DN1593_c5_g2_i1.p1 TRINITY_DN1593_c5_g2~~TRINITY_DN1593_c5_g2_i1.p1  ORF type:complete len:143 (+),score=46.14 TRINITY_DN1593_c5_g2_i1:37-465(+)
MSDKNDKKEEAPKSAEELQMEYSQIKQHHDQIARKLAEMEVEKHDHVLVEKALTPLEPERKCFRSIGGVLIEKTVKEVLPVIQDSVKKIEEVIENLTKQAAAKQQEMSDFIDKHQLNATAGGAGPQQPAAASEQPKKAGVLA